MDATCKTCPFWTRKTGEPVEGVPDPGYCHHVHAASEEDPQRRGEWWCSEHPLRQRDRLAAMAMQGLCANSGPNAEWTAEQIATFAYEQANAMLAARSPRSGEEADRE